MATQQINPCAESHQELSLMLKVTSLTDRLPVMHCNRCGENLSYEDAVRNDERIQIRKASRVPYVELTAQEKEAVHDWCALHDIDRMRVPIHAPH